MMMILFLLSLVAGTEYGADVVWRVTKHKIITGCRNINYTIIIQNPCLQIKPPVHVEIRTTNYPCDMKHGPGLVNKFTCLERVRQAAPHCEKHLKPYCDRLPYNKEDVFELARKHCENYVDLHMTRSIFGSNAVQVKKEKCELTTTLLIGSLAVIGFGKIKDWIYKSKDDNLLSQSTNLTLEVLNIHQESLKKIADQVQSTRARLDDLEEMIPVTALQSATVVYQTQRINEILRETRVEMEKGNKIPESLIKFFQVELPCGDNCPLNTMENCQVSFKQVNKTFLLELLFRVDIYANHLLIHKADPFTLVEEKNGTEICVKNYVGPKFILTNETSQPPEICEVDQEDFESKKLNFNTGQFCRKVPETGLWKLSDCMEISPNNYKLRKPQTKVVNEDFYVYCRGHNLTILNITRPCPNQVLKISRSMFFRIGDTSYTPTELTLIDEKDVTSWSTSINWQLSPYDYEHINLEPEKLEMLEKAVRKVQEQSNEPWFISLKRELFNLFLGLIAFSILIMLFLKIIKMILSQNPTVYSMSTEPVTLKNDEGKVKKEKQNSETDYVPLNQLF
ncbi:uncharacterized protein LOC128396331 [Panonychus citri]|uniref:uncharacterized protein LOC128396331 n=1 Tax=Panonychus citri TaxID=50023 RepID=UPI002306EECC|nr:uncharacterized protein LOC128396331 [Panonychus citri]